MTAIWSEVIKIGETTTIVGDLNIDRLKSNDPKKSQPKKYDSNPV